ncbi:MAG: hypothetical protein WAV00_00020 [Nocardioides sp.]
MIEVNRRECGIVALLCLSTALITTYVGMAGFRADDVATSDNQRYTALALGHTDVLKPFHYRVLVPAVVRMLPSLSSDPVRAAQLGFAAIDVGALSVAGFALYLLLRTWRATPAIAVIGVLFFYLSHPVLRFATVPMIESSAWAVLILAMLAAERRLHLALIAVVLVGMFVKETTVIALVYPLVMTAPLAQRLRLSACALPGVIAYAAFRLLNPAPGYTYSSTAWLHNLWTLASLQDLARWRTIVLAYGLWWLLLPIALRLREGLVPNRYSWLIAGCFTMAAILSTDYERVLFLVFPIVLGLCLPTFVRLLTSSTVFSGVAATQEPTGTSP